MVYESKYKFDVHPSYRSRNMWIHKDICRFHGDETRVAETQNITPLCVDDRVEIAVNLFNGKGMVDIPNIKWRPLRRDAIGVRECYIEEDLMDWSTRLTFLDNCDLNMQVNTGSSRLCLILYSEGQSAAPNDSRGLASGSPRASRRGVTAT